MAITGRGVGLGERGMCVILDIMKINTQIAVWEGNLYSYASTLRESLLLEEGVGILM